MDRAAVGELAHPEIVVHTARTVHRGREAASAWADKGFDHLERHYVPREVEATNGGVRVRAWLQYLWKETGEVGDSTPVVIELGVRDGLIASWRLHEADEPDQPPLG